MKTNLFTLLIVFDNYLLSLYCYLIAHLQVFFYESIRFSLISTKIKIQPGKHS